MKKILLFVLVAILAVALVACGGDNTTTAGTTAADTSTTVADISTTDPDTSTTDPDNGGEDDPEISGYDLINEIYAIEQWSDMVFCTFEDTHGALDFHPAVVFRMNDYDQVYEELFLTEMNEDGTWNTDVWKYNDEFTWYFIIDDQKFECTRFSLMNGGSSGWVRADLGANFSYDKFEYVDGVHNYTVKLEIYDNENELCYYADFTEYSEYVHEKPVKVEMKEDTKRPSGSVSVPASVVTATSGPETNKGEGYKNLFDNDVRSKLCSTAEGLENAIKINFSTAQNIGAISLVNANDNTPYTSRTVIAFDIYVSNDGGQTWGETPAVSFSANDENGDPIDKSGISANYAENYFDFGKVLENVSDVMFVINNGAEYQISELIFWLG